MYPTLSSFPVGEVPTTSTPNIFPCWCNSLSGVARMYARTLFISSSAAACAHGWGGRLNGSAMPLGVMLRIADGGR